MAAEQVRPEDINFMATHARGLICLTLTPDRCKLLELPPMVSDNQAQHSTNFTVSIEAAEGVTTGISAADRARTVRAAVNRDAVATDIVQPGHIFPLMAQPGGVMSRAGHTEAGCDLARLAGFDPSAAIVEIMNEDGTMARLPELVAFAQKHGLKIGTISDLIAYRRRYDNLVRETDHHRVTSEFGGDWDMRIFTDFTYGIEHVALIKGDIASGGPVLTRTHALHEASDILGLGPKPVKELPRAMELIAAEGRGVVCLFREPRHSLYAPEEEGPRTIKNTGLGAQILSSLGVEELVLLTDSPSTTYLGIDAYGLSIVGTRPILKES